ncbi:TorD/DmsD family molecular chaperone [Arcobacter sp. YIC-80]|uniref:TorD/DmsD family molecular chaperone n=1 Tax=unclassified Arcobacter TaxID=2593671 RepID=UPI00385003B3
MQDNQAVNKARALYYNLFANFFVPPESIENYLELTSLIYILRQNPLDKTSGDALAKIEDLLDRSSNIPLLQEFDDIFHNPTSKKIRTTASFYDEGVESGKKRVEMINFVAKTKLRRDEKKFHEYEDSVGFIFTLMSELTDLISQGEKEYENTVHCIFAQILNEFIDEFAKELYEHDNAVIYKELMIVLHSFVEFERLYLEVSKPIPKEKIEKVETCEVEEISEEERQRRERNRALRAMGPKKEQRPTDIAYDVEEDI